MTKKFGSWGSPDTPPLDRFIARTRRALADPTIQKVTVPIEELKAAFAALTSPK